MSHANLSRRAMMTAAASVAAVPVVAVLPTASTAFTAALPIEPDPILAAIAEHRRLFRQWLSLFTALDEAAHEKGHPPCPLISWRKYDAIGGKEVEKARDEFLADRIAKPATIEREYREAKAREQAAKQARRRWYKQNGLADLKTKSDRASKVERTALSTLTKLRPTTTAGAGALVAYVCTDLEYDGEVWQKQALTNAAKALRNMGGEQIAREAVQS